MDYNVRYTRRARGDLGSIYSYISAHSSQGSQAVKHAIQKRIILLGSFPFAAPLTNHQDVHELSIVRYPYKAYYRVEGRKVWVLRIRHAKRAAWNAEDD